MAGIPSIFVIDFYYYIILTLLKLIKNYLSNLVIEIYLILFTVFVF